MKSKLLLSVLLFFFFYLLSSQVPQGINYQALAGDASGNQIRNTDLQVNVSILSDTIQPVVVWEELHSTIRTNFQGIFSLVIGSGVRQSSSSATAFNDIDWSATPLFIKTQIYYQGTWKNMGSAKLWTVPYAMVAENLSGTLKKLAVTGETANMDEALFEVKNKTGQTVFAVYNEGVRIYVDDGAKGAKGGFAIGGFGGTKAAPQNYFIVKPDTVRIYIDDTPGKSAKGGFAIGGFGSTKGVSQKLLTVSPDSIRMYIDANTKSAKGGFAIGGFGGTKGNNNSFLDVATDASGIINPSQNRILWYPLKNAFLTGKVLIENPDSVGENSFATGYESKAVGQFSQALGYQAIARGDYSTAIGRSAVANKINSFAFGENAHALNQDSYAFGAFSEARGIGSFAFGYVGRDSLGPTGKTTIASGNYSFAFGLGSQATSESAFAFGADNLASNYFSMAFGLSTKSTGGAATTFGHKTLASEWVSMAIGQETEASGWGSFAGGLQSKASGFAAVAWGQTTIATGNYSTAFGVSTNASGLMSTAIGSETEASGFSSFAGGYLSNASADRAFAFGKETNAIGAGSVAFGDRTYASGGLSTAFGIGTICSGWSSMAIGEQSLASGIEAFAGGNLCTASGAQSFAFGYQTKAKGDLSVALGDNTTAVGRSTLALGYLTKAKPYASFVIGQYNDTLCLETDWWTGIDPVFVIGNGSDEANRKNAFTVLQNGKTAIGHTSPTEMLDVNGNARFRAIGSGAYSSSLAISSDGTLTTSTSDISMKKNIVPISYALQKVMEMNGVYFSWKNDNMNNRRVGFIAQEMEKVLPEVVFTNPVDGLKGINYPEITAILAQAVKEQEQKIENQQKEIEELKTLVNALISNQTAR